MIYLPRDVWPLLVSPRVGPAHVASSGWLVGRRSHGRRDPKGVDDEQSHRGEVMPCRIAYYTRVFGGLWNTTALVGEC